MTKAHEHCWHVKSSTTNGMGVSGWDTEICCHCGGTRERHWDYIEDPAHGPHSPLRVLHYHGDPR